MLDPFTFITDLRFIGGYYANNPRGGYGVTSAVDHARVVSTFLTLSFFSPFRWLAVIKSVAVVAGMIVLLRRDWRLAVVLGSFVVVFLAAFVMKCRLVVVRNYLFVTPFLALALGVALGAVTAWMRRGWPQRTFNAALACCIAGEGAWIIAAAESIRDPDRRHAVRQALEYVAAHAGQRFLIAPSVRHIAQENGYAFPRNVGEKGRPDRVVYFAQADGPNPWFTQTNDPFRTEAVFGPREVNLDWYSTWSGHDHVLVVDASRERNFGPKLLYELRGASR